MVCLNNNHPFFRTQWFAAERGGLLHDVWNLRTVDDMKHQSAIGLYNYFWNQDMPQRPFFLGGIPSGEPGRYILLGNGIFAVVVNGGDAILQH